MCAKWVEKFNPNVLIKELNESRTQSDGKVTYQNLGYSYFYTALASAIFFADDIPRAAQSGMLHAALFSPTQSGKLSSDSIIKELAAQEQRYRKLPTEQFCIVTSLSVKGPLPIKDLRVDGAHIQFNPNTRKFNTRDLEQELEQYIHGTLPTTYRRIAVSVTARGFLEAAHSALEKIDTVRGLWCLYLNHSKLLRMRFGGRAKPINDIRLGPMHTIHKPNGALAVRTFLYEPTYVDAGDLFDLSNQIPQLRRQFLRTWPRVKASPLKSSAQKALVRYTRALDNWNLHTAFLELWSILEYLTQTYSAQRPFSHDNTIRRAAALYRNRELSIEMLKHLRDRRNLAVHASTTDDDAELLVFQLKRFVEDLLIFYLNNHYDLRSRDEVGAFLDLVRDNPASVSRSMAIEGAALRFRKPRSSDADPEK